ncbi:FKBP-type peptidyl-prolyl cis-trans isomerase [Siphonobacter aquaeclarae]|uniref:Peptidyl-prolyl cis-trans isomerase n=1 Tax=Siphonobacter aquaeclarae TaxID=563176 RepID=A0A1G9SU41_9BACT|nr:FKBP-type peptidyl-prolyl cis-trans isomerase [Siphonobacter aquaeclarae]SDM38999.1 FKBP-type peptidyl-prolyl cis-trans isomerase FklB [Siphonobacter aquaeclarae]
MKKTSIAVLLAAFSLPALAQTKKPAPKPAVKKPVAAVAPSFKSPMDSVSYAIGMDIAKNLKNPSLSNLNFDLVAKAVLDSKAGKFALTDAEYQNCLTNFSQQMRAKQAEEQAKTQAENAKKYEPNKLAGEKFLAENKTKDSVVTLPSGLQYKVIKLGTGAKPTLSDKVKTHYHGTLIDGTVFDSSVQRGEPISFPLNGVIQGWQEGLQQMPVGSKYRLFVPYQLAYGERATGSIPPYSVLIFDVELLDIEK